MYWEILFCLAVYRVFMYWIACQEVKKEQTNDKAQGD
jgi:hypothetical protein